MKTYVFPDQDGWTYPGFTTVSTCSSRLVEIMEISLSGFFHSVRSGKGQSYKFVKRDRAE
jgi:hypothetical protein